MADGWEKLYGCTSRLSATLHGFSRVLDKASTQSRGSREHPAPTLRIVRSQSSCRGIAFQFEELHRKKVLAELLKREGRTFPLREMIIELEDGRRVAALVPIYEGKQLLSSKSVRELAEMAIQAEGERGNGIDYVRDIVKHLDVAGIEDPAISNVLREIERFLARGKTNGVSA